MAHEAEVLGEILMADIFQYLGVIFLMLSFGIFLEEKLGYQFSFILAGVIVFTVSYLGIGCLNMYKFYKNMMKNKKTGAKSVRERQASDRRDIQK